MISLPRAPTQDLPASVRQALERSWTKEMDEVLREGVLRFGEEWEKVAAHMKPHKCLPLECCNRWQMVYLNEVKGPWSPEEDDLLRHLVRKHGSKKWSYVAQQFPGRSGKQCRERWLNHLDCSVKKSFWTEEEDNILCEAQKTMGNKWSQISTLLPGRAENAVKNRFNSIITKRLTAQGPHMEGDIFAADYGASPSYPEEDSEFSDDEDGGASGSGQVNTDGVKEETLEGPPETQAAELMRTIYRTLGRASHIRIPPPMPQMPLKVGRRSPVSATRRRSLRQEQQQGGGGGEYGVKQELVEDTDRLWKGEKRKSKSNDGGGMLSLNESSFFPTGQSDCAGNGLGMYDKRWMGQSRTAVAMQMTRSGVEEERRRSELFSRVQLTQEDMERLHRNMAAEGFKLEPSPGGGIESVAHGWSQINVKVEDVEPSTTQKIIGSTGIGGTAFAPMYEHANGVGGGIHAHSHTPMLLHDSSTGKDDTDMLPSPLQISSPDDDCMHLDPLVSNGLSARLSRGSLQSRLSPYLPTCMSEDRQHNAEFLPAHLDGFGYEDGSGMRWTRRKSNNSLNSSLNGRRSGGGTPDNNQRQSVGNNGLRRSSVSATEAMLRVSLSSMSLDDDQDDWRYLNSDVRGRGSAFSSRNSTPLQHRRSSRERRSGSLNNSLNGSLVGDPMCSNRSSPLFGRGSEVGVAK